MPELDLDLADPSQSQDEDVLKQAMRAGLTGAPPSPTATPTGRPLPAPNGVQPTPPALDTNLMRHAMSAGVKTLPNRPPTAPSIPETSVASPTLRNVVDKSTTMPPAPNAGIRLGELIQQRAKAGTPLDPNDPKYRMGWGERILDSVANFASNFATKGNSPTTYVGKGATNSRYDRDLAQQQKTTANLDTEIGNTDKLNKENESLYRDAIRQAYEAQVGQARGETAEAQKEAAAARQTAADAAKEKADVAAGAREITYDPKTKRFMQGGKVYVPKTVEEGASLEAANNVNGRYTKLWGGERRNQPARGPQFSARDNLRLEAKARELGKNISDLTDDEINSALYKPRTAGAAKDNSKSVSDAIEKKNTDLQAEEAKFKKRWDAANKDGAAKEDLDQLTQEHNDRKQEIIDTFGQRVQVLDPDGSIQARIGKGGQAPAAAPQPQAPAAKPAPQAATKPQATPQRKVGDVVPTKNGNMKITKILPNGKYEGVPAGQ